MKNIILLIALSVFSDLFCADAFAKVANIKARSKKAAVTTRAEKNIQNQKHPMGAQLGTDFNVDEAAVHGRYETSLAGVATVENEKKIRDLIDYRSDYKNRLTKSLTQK
ncbi:MAG: hypothetical protein ABL927_03740 [Bdellovibrionales bacterium]